jgi:hypothetical protein
MQKTAFSKETLEPAKEKLFPNFAIILRLPNFFTLELIKTE